jgi:2-dehydro-3-deoxyglucarate aldolase
MDLKEKIAGRKVTIGSWLTLNCPEVAEIMSRAGYDWLTIDMEHSAITLEGAQNMIRVIDLCGVSPLVRVGKNDSNLIKRVMDAGAHGVIVPMVNSGEEAEHAVKSVKYPPIGFRGVGLARAQGYGVDFEEYKQWNQEKSIVIVQIEHFKAVENLEEILSVEGVDGFLVGPYDLSGSLGYPGRFDHPLVAQALEKIRKIAEKMGALSGFHVISPETAEVKEKIEKGFHFIAHSLDTMFLNRACIDANHLIIKEFLKRWR